MYLSSISLKNFRSFKDGVVSFNQHLTTLVGENNSGKSNIIDAIRLLTLPLNDRRDRYCEEEDVRVGAEPQQFTLNATYNELTPGQKGLLVTALLDPTQDAAVFGVTFKPATQLKPRGDVKYWAGKHSMEPESGSTDLIRHVYLPPLRDAQRVLASGNPTRILSLLRHFIGDDSKEQQLVNDLARTTDNETLTTVNTTVGNFLNELTTGVRPQTTRLGFSENEKLGDIARDLRFKLSDHGISPEDLTHSGLGFSNLLFMATILVELEKAQEADLTLLLVEEPEAHLHPQLQSAVLGFLLEQAQKSQKKEITPGKPEGRIQVIVTTHSPNMASGVAPEHLTVVRSIQQDGDDRRQSVSIPVSQLQIPPKDLAKIERYIDVTKSSLLFGQRCLLVEGIAEALLLPAIARRYVFNGQDDASRKGLRQFNGTALIPIDGVDFEPYLKVLLSKYKDNTICDLAVIVTLAKLAAGARAAKWPVVAITCDLAKAGGIDQLATYAKAMGITAYQAKNAGALKRAIGAAPEGALVLIDTAGINPLKPDDMAAMAELAAAAKAEPVLVLAAGGDVSESAEQGQLFSEIGCQRLMATRIDAARRYGALLACAEGGKLALAEFGISPEIANGLMFFGADALARLLMPQEMADGPKRAQNATATRVDDMARAKPVSGGGGGNRKRPVGSRT